MLNIRVNVYRNHPTKELNEVQHTGTLVELSGPMNGKEALVLLNDGDFKVFRLDLIRAVDVINEDSELAVLLEETTVKLRETQAHLEASEEQVANLMPKPEVKPTKVINKPSKSN